MANYFYQCTFKSTVFSQDRKAINLVLEDYKTEIPNSAWSRQHLLLHTTTLDTRDISDFFAELFSDFP